MTVRTVARSGATGPIALEPQLFESLRKLEGDSLVSIYVPTHVRGADFEQDRIRFKNEVARAEELLERAGWKPREREERLSAAIDLISNRDFWRYQEEGLGVFIGDDAELIAVAIPGGTQQVSVLSRTFHIRPLVAALESTELSVLVLTKGGVALYRVSTNQADRVEAALPRSFEDVNWFVDREKQRQQHPGRVGLKRSGHGHEGGTRDEDLARYLRAVAEAIPAPAGDGPLVVLGDDNLTDRFIGFFDHEAVSPADSGVADPDNMEEVRRLAVPIVAARSAETARNTADQARSSLNTGDAITDLEEAMMSAVGGRVGTLVIDADATPKWGSFDAESGELTEHDHQEPYSVDLLDRLVVEAMATGAVVTNYPGLVDGHSFVAIPRY